MWTPPQRQKKKPKKKKECLGVPRRIRGGRGKGKEERKR